MVLNFKTKVTLEMSHHQARLYDLTRYFILNLKIIEQDANSATGLYIYVKLCTKKPSTMYAQIPRCKADQR